MVVGGMEYPRLWTAMITPYDIDLEVNYSKAGEIAEYLMKNGTEGLIVSGTTGESPVLTETEQLQLFAAVKSRIGNRIPVWGGTGSNNTAHAVELSREAEKIGIDGLLLVVPYYNKPNQDSLYLHFKKIAESVSLPIMLYNIPGRTAINMLPATIARLAEIDNIVALKESTGDMDQLSSLKNLVADEFLIYSGDDSLTLPMMALGAHGVVSIASHLVGREISAMINAFNSGDVRKAYHIHRQLFTIFKGLFITSNPVPLKTALNILGMEVGGLRLPLSDANKEQANFIKELLIKHNLLR